MTTYVYFVFFTVYNLKTTYLVTLKYIHFYVCHFLNYFLTHYKLMYKQFPLHLTKYQARAVFLMKL